MSFTRKVLSIEIKAPSDFYKNQKLDDDIEDFVCRYGNLVAITSSHTSSFVNYKKEKIIVHKYTIEYERSFQAEKACEELKTRTLDGNKLKCELFDMTVFQRLK